MESNGDNCRGAIVVRSEGFHRINEEFDHSLMVVMHAGYSDVRMSDQHWPTTACPAVCEVMFDPDYASLMGKAAEIARPVERKAAEPAKQPRAG